ncbi:MAG TPA: peptide-methionine (S)-S-oxide reductase MsrA [Planctomycetaceae bacterium]|nr:peptide-methionine (S)-S-oxide reductase MsrA [Planctomycetaceae bacterium]
MKNRRSAAILMLCGAGLVVALGVEFALMSSRDTPEASLAAVPQELPAGHERATFGAGCFWCTEAVFERLQGVHSAASGYSGGDVARPDYRLVCTGTTGHAEVVQITYDPRVVTYDELLEVFWKTHDPTTPNRQGADVGTQYRSVIFYHTDEQRRLAEQYKRKLDASGAFEAPIVTEIVPFREFYPAETYHQKYFEQNPSQAYCRVVIAPKVEKFEKVFAAKLKR